MIPEQRRFVGIILLVVGMMSLMLTSGVIVAIAHARKESASRFTEERDSCKKRLASLGGNVTESGSRLIWLKENIEEGPARLGEASVAAELCPGWKLANACMGSECPDANAMRVVLEPFNGPAD